MGDNYLGMIIRRNWRFFLGGILLILVVGFILKNVGEIPYENQHLMQSSQAIKFDHQGETIRGFLYAFYWVETDPSKVQGMSKDELEDYIYENGRLNLERVKGDMTELLKSLSPAEIREKYYSDYQYFKMRDFYYVKSDPQLERLIREHDFNVSLPHALKKVFFIYLSEDEYNDPNNAYQYEGGSGSS